MIRLGLIGCGTWGWRYIPAADDAKNAVVSYCTKPNHQAVTMRGFARWSFTLSPTIVPDWRELAESPVDAFVVATPPDSHEEICSYLLEKGRPVMVEKPMTLSVESSLRLQRLSQRNGAPFLVNHVHLFAPAYASLRDEVASSGVGPYSIHGRGGGLGPFRNGYSSLWDYGPHDVAMCLGLGLGPPTHVSCVSAPDGEDGRHYDVNLAFGKSRALIQVWNGSLPKQRRFEVVGQGMKLVYDGISNDGFSYERNGVPVPVSNEKPLSLAVRAFADAVSTGKTDWRFGADMAVTIARVCEAAEAGNVRA